MTPIVEAIEVATVEREDSLYSIRYPFHSSHYFFVSETTEEKN